MLSTEAKSIISDHTAGMVATINSNGSPSVSPKATFVILNDRTIAFGNIRSPHTLANLRARPEVEVCFIDVVLRKSVRVSGKAVICPKADADPELLAAFEASWHAYLEHMSHFVSIDIQAAQVILSPAYDLGITEEELRRTNLERLNAL